MTRLKIKDKDTSNHQKRQDILEKIKALVTNHNRLASIVQQELDKTDSKFDDLAITIKAIATVIGEEAVANEAKKIRIDISEKTVASQEAAVQKQLEAGGIQPVDAVAAGLLVITAVTKADGTILYPSKNFLPLEHYHQNVQPLLIGKKVGDVVEYEGNLIKVVGIYGNAEPPATSELVCPVDQPEGQVEATPTSEQ